MNQNNCVLMLVYNLYTEHDKIKKCSCLWSFVWQSFIIHIHTNFKYFSSRVVDEKKTRTLKIS